MKYQLTSSTWDKKEVRAINDVIKSNFYTYGKYVSLFEKKFASFFQKKYAVMANSGSSANLLAVASLFFKKKNPLKRGDEVIVPAISWSTSYFPLMQYGLKLRFVDVNLNTLNADFETIAKACTKNTKLILAVSILGNPTELDKLKLFCQKRKIYLMEDNCETMGAKIAGKYAGTFGIVNTFSTFFSHHISTIEGGVLLTDDFEIYNIAKSLRSHGWTRDFDKNFYLKKKQGLYQNYCFVLPGYNLRPTNINGAIGLEQLKKLKKFVKVRKSNYGIYKKIFSDNKFFHIQQQTPNSSTSSFAFTFVFKKKFRYLKNSVYKLLKKNNIEFRLITGGCYLKHPVSKMTKYSIYNNLKNANYIHDNGFFVGNHPRPLKNEINFLNNVFKKIKI